MQVTRATAPRERVTGSGVAVGCVAEGLVGIAGVVAITVTGVVAGEVGTGVGTGVQGRTNCPDVEKLVSSDSTLTWYSPGGKADTFTSKLYVFRGEPGWTVTVPAAPEKPPPVPFSVGVKAAETTLTRSRSPTARFVLPEMVTISPFLEKVRLPPCAAAIPARRTTARIAPATMTMFPSLFTG
jgi:hypothetical protein